MIEIATRAGIALWTEVDPKIRVEPMIKVAPETHVSPRLKESTRTWVKVALGERIG